MSECFFDEDGNLNSSPRPEAVERLRDILKGWEPSKEDLVWGPELDFSDEKAKAEVKPVDYKRFRSSYVCSPECKGGIGPCKEENKKEKEDE